MKREKFESISANAEQLYQRRPKLYKFLLASMATLGYAYIILILLVSLTLFVLMLILLFSGKTRSEIIKLLIVFGVLSWFILRGLWIKFTPPFGLRITRKEAPRLVDMVEDVCNRLGAPHVSEIVLNGEFNASVSQLPRLGILGWYKNYLTIGLPLLHALSPEQLKSVLAHEFGHLSGSHGKFGIWIYRVHQTWQQVIQSFAQHQSAAVYLFLPFYKWFVPRFSAFAYVQNWLHEFEADFQAAKLVGSENTINALVRIHFYGELLEERFWPDIYKLADTQATVPAPYEKMAPFVKAFDDYITADFAVRRFFQLKHEGADTHPVLAERVAAVEGPASVMTTEKMERLVRMCLAREQSAAELCLDGQRDNLTAQIDGMWQKMLESEWTQRHAYMKQQREELISLENKAASSSLDTDESIQLAHLTEAIHGPQKALPLFENLAALQPDNMQAVFSVGRLLLEQKNPSGQPLIERVMEKMPSSRPTGCELLAKFHYDLGDLEKAKLWRFKMEDEYSVTEAAQNERTTLTTSDKFLPHGLDEAAVKQICDQLASIPIPMRVCLAKKVVKLLPDNPCYVLVAHRIVPWWHWSDSSGAGKKTQELLDQQIEKINTSISVYIFVEPQPSVYKKLKKKSGCTDIFLFPITENLLT
jgi:Zn-dependent protease with chaperone function